MHIHSTFNIPANQNLKNYKSLDSSRLNTLRAELAALKVIFLDEVLMVGSSMFNLQISKRLQDIMGNKLDFGGVSIAAIGDLFQLQPVFDHYVFDSLETPYGPLACNLWNKHFRMFELQEIMRQKESKTFAQILNHLREGLHTHEDINKLKERICISQTESEAYNHIPHLFIQNKRVEEFNLLMHNKAPRPKFVIQATDSVIGAHTKKLKEQILKQIPVDDPKRTKQLRTHLCIAIGERTEIALNLHLDDGITNGAGNVVKKVTLYNPPHPHGVIWVQFDQQCIGRKTRQENMQHYTQGIDKAWTPVKPITTQFNVGRNKTASIVRKQFPLRPAAAKTVHRSQGDTEREIFVDLESPRAIPHIHYVALSRVTSIEGLHIRNSSENNHAQLSSSLKFIYNIPNDMIKISFLNAQSLHRHFLDFKNDFNLQASDWNIICETRFSPWDDDSVYQINNLLLFRNDDVVKEQGARPYYGMAIYSKNIFALGYPKKNNLHGVEITIFKLHDYRNLIIAGIYRYPKVTLQNLYMALSELIDLLAHERYSVIMGDFNTNLFDVSQTHTILKMMFQQSGYQQHINEYTTDNRTLLDHIYSNLPLQSTITGVSETYCSYHKGVYIAIDKGQLS